MIGPLSPVTLTRLEKAAVNNGFDLERERDGNWLGFDSSQTSLRIWLTAFGESMFLVAFSRSLPDTHRQRLQGRDRRPTTVLDVVFRHGAGAAPR